MNLVTNEQAPPPSRNIELKARCDDLELAQRLCEGFGTRDGGVLTQTDTYFRVSRGRLKLREIEPNRAELIFYERPDANSSRPSDYLRVPVSDPGGMKQALSLGIGVLVQVRKRRRLLLWQNVRIHLDQVVGLGSFIEFEAVLSCTDGEARGHDQIDELCKLLSIKEEDRIGVSYSDLLIQSQSPETG